MSDFQLRSGQELWLHSKVKAWATGTLTVRYIDPKGRPRFDGGYFINPHSLVMFHADGTIVGQCYPNQAEYLRSVELDQLWRQFQIATIRQWRAPKQVSCEEIRHAAEILGLPLNQPEVENVRNSGVPVSDPSQGLLL